MKYPDECYFNYSLFDPDLSFQASRRLVRNNETNPLPTYIDALLDAISANVDSIVCECGVHQMNGDELQWAPIMVAAAIENTTRVDRNADILRLPTDETIREVEPRLRAADLWMGETVICDHLYGGSGQRLFLQDLLVADGRLLRVRLPDGRCDYHDCVAV